MHIVSVFIPVMSKQVVRLCRYPLRCLFSIRLTRSLRKRSELASSRFRLIGNTTCKRRQPTSDNAW